MHDIEWIERYLDRSLNKEERLDMEHRLEADPELRNKYDAHRQLIDGIRLSHLHQKLEQLRSLEKSLPQIEGSSKAGKQINMVGIWAYRKPIAVAASLVLVVTSFLLTYDPAPANEKLFTAYYQPFDSPGLQPVELLQAS